MVPLFVDVIEFLTNSAVPWNTPTAPSSSFSAPPLFSYLGGHTGASHKTVIALYSQYHAAGACFRPLFLQLPPLLCSVLSQGTINKYFYTERDNGQIMNFVDVVTVHEEGTHKATMSFGRKPLNS